MISIQKISALCRQSGKEKLMNNYSGTKPESFIKRILKGWMYYIIGFVMNLWLVTVMMAMASDFLIVKFFLGIAALVVVDGLFFNYAFNASRRDRELIKFHGMEQDKKIEVLMKNLISTFKDSGLHILVEGVETEEQDKLVKAAGVEYIQGFLYSKPVPEKEYLKILQKY